jgi:hypothetical protein
MSALERLERRLENGMAAERGRFAADRSVDTTRIERAGAALRNWLVDRDLQGPPGEQVFEALEAFDRAPEIRSLRQARLLCFGAAQRDRAGRRLIEDGARFAALLRGVDSIASQPRGWRRCVRGLLRAYFDYDYDLDATPDIGRRNFAELRHYLQQRAQATTCDGIRPLWVQSLQENLDVLTEDAGQRYAQRLNADDGEALASIRGVFGIAEHSWLARRVLLARIDLVCRANDAAFLKAIDGFLRLLGQHPAIGNAGLVTILRRYRECHGARAHVNLFDAAIARWGNPLVSSNREAWRQVDDTVRTTVAAWLKTKVIAQFFGPLLQNGKADLRRADFWLQYADSIDDLCLALRPDARVDRRPELLQLRQSMAGRLFSVAAAGRNVLILRIRGHVLIEFGRPAEVCNVFEGDALPFTWPGGPAPEAELGIGAGDNELQRDARVIQLDHRDSRTEKWETRFEEFLRKTVGARPRRGAS